MVTKMKNDRDPVAEDVLQQLTASPNGSLFYETRMLNASADACLKLEGRKSVEEWMAIESFLIHFRNLRDFLYPDKKISIPILKA